MPNTFNLYRNQLISDVLICTAYVIKMQVYGFLRVMGQQRRQQKIQQWPYLTRSISTCMLIERMLTKPLTSSVPPVPVSHGQFAPLSSIQDFSSSVVSNQITVIFKWFSHLLEFFFSFPELVLWEKCLHKASLPSECFLLTHHPQIRKNSRNMIKITQEME